MKDAPAQVLQAFITTARFATNQNQVFPAADSIPHSINDLRARTSLAISEKAHESMLRPDVIIEEIELDDARQLESMSRFCIDMFFNSGESAEKDGTFISRCVVIVEEIAYCFLSLMHFHLPVLQFRGWKNIKIAALQKAQMLVGSLYINQMHNYV
jgi:hypothetical protein